MAVDRHAGGHPRGRADDCPHRPWRSRPRRPRSREADDGPSLYLVTLRGPGLSGYHGPLAGVAARARLTAQQDASLVGIGVTTAPMYRWTDALNGYAVTLTPPQAAQLAADPTVALVEENAVRSLAATQRRAPGTAVGRSRGGSGVVVGVDRLRPVAREPAVRRRARPRPTATWLPRHLPGGRGVGPGHLQPQGRGRALVRRRLRRRQRARLRATSPRATTAATAPRSPPSPPATPTCPCAVAASPWAPSPGSPRRPG